MIIIENGDKERAIRKREKRYRFSCKDCGCVWSAKAGEYTWGNQIDPGPFCNCPCCGKKFCDSLGLEV